MAEKRTPMHRAVMRSIAFEGQAAVARAIVDEGYSAFAGRRLKLNFDERCSPFSDRRELARQMSREDLRVVDEESMACLLYTSPSPRDS